MNISTILLWPFGSNPMRNTALLCMALTLVNSVCLADSDLEKQLFSLFSVLESPTSDAKRVEMAMKQILALDTDVSWSVQKRFEQTQNPRYLYLLQKLQKAEAVPDSKNWNKESYFGEQYQKAQKHLNTGDYRRAHNIAQAILTLEPNISFHNDVRQFIHRCNDKAFSHVVANGEIVAKSPFVSSGNAISIDVILKNHRPLPVTLYTNNSGIVMEIKIQEFGLTGGVQEENISRTISLTEKILLAPEQRQKTTFNIPNPVSAFPVYRVFKIKGKIPRCKVNYSDQESYPNILFQEITVVSFPTSFHQVMQDPLQSALSSVRLKYPEHLFFATFFLKREEQAQLIPVLIDSLGIKNDLDLIFIGILRRFTGNNFVDKAVWQNWWHVYGPFWKDEDATVVYHGRN